MSDTNAQPAGTVAFGLPAEVHSAARPSVERAALELLSVVRASMPEAAAGTRSFAAYVSMLAVLAAGDLTEDDVQCAVGHATASSVAAIAESKCGHLGKAVQAFNEQATANLIYFQHVARRFVAAAAAAPAPAEGSALQ